MTWRTTKTCWRFNAEYDPFARDAPGGIEFYGRLNGRAIVWVRPYEAPPEIPDEQYPCSEAPLRVPTTFQGE